jgi:hypothetical protein
MLAATLARIAPRACVLVARAFGRVAGISRLPIVIALPKIRPIKYFDPGLLPLPFEFQLAFHAFSYWT